MPLTSNGERLYPSEAYVELSGEQRKAGMLSTSDMVAVDRAMRIQLGL